MSITVDLHGTKEIHAEANHSGITTWIDLSFITNDGDFNLVVFTEDLAVAQAYADAINTARRALSVPEPEAA